MAVKIAGKQQATGAATKNYVKHLVSTPIEVEAQVELPKGKTESYSDCMGKVVLPVDELILVEVKGGRTLNLGNYESARIDIGIRVPCVKADLVDTYQWAADWISGRIKEAVKEAKE